jgi:hypothetical protein
MARFAAFADMAEKRGLQLLVGLVTGWMSGRLFVPPAFAGCNVLTDPLAILSCTPGAFHLPQAQPFWELYRHVAEPFCGKRAVRNVHPQVGVTEHLLSGRRRVVVAINYGPTPVEFPLEMTPPWSAAETWYGAAAVGKSRYLLSPNDALVLLLKRGGQ